MDKQKDVIRRLAERVMQIAQSEEMPAILQRWKDVNELRKPDRPPVWCKPVGCWSELLPEESLECTEPWLRNIEIGFRQILIKADIGDDSPVYPWFAVPAVVEVTPPNTWGVAIRHVSSAEKGGAWAYDPPLKTPEDLDKLAMPKYTFHRRASLLALEKHHDLLGDILPVKLKFGPSFDSATLGTAAADLRGLTEMMMDLILQPDAMHRLMKHMLRARLNLLDEYEAFREDLCRNNDQPMLLSDDFGPAEPAVSLKNCWCAGNSQEFDQISPDMFEEFCLQYQMPIFERFGRVCYGCCEDLSKKIDMVMKIKNLRIFVASAWTGLDVPLEHINGDYCIMWRQKASDVVMPHSTDALKEDLELGAKKLKGRFYQVVLRELQTLAGHGDRLKVWTRLAKEAVSRYS
ncbi:MAG: hypothetical protein JW849_10625 [Phycisphaerae bacterium]|nr:hypothetical protein [Phycisphaerae bacterium]